MFWRGVYVKFHLKIASEGRRKQEIKGNVYVVRLNTKI
jgi:hypothetical protein